MHRRRRLTLAAACAALIAASLGSRPAGAAPPRQRCRIVKAGQVVCWVVKDCDPGSGGAGGWPASDRGSGSAAGGVFAVAGVCAGGGSWGVRGLAAVAGWW